MKTVNVVSSNDGALKHEIDVLNRRINDLKLENSNYQSMLRNAKSTEKVIVREYHDGNSYGMNSSDVEKLALRNAALELELKRLLDS